MLPKVPKKTPVQALGTYKFAGDPTLCSMRKWRWCYLPGNLETFRRIFNSIGMREIPPLPLDLEGGPPWQLLWELADEADGNDYSIYKRMTPSQVINHFPGVRELGNKKFLHRNMANAVDHFGKSIYNIFPESFSIPKQIVELNKEHQKNQNQMYILKIAAKDRGEGIKVISGPSDLKPTDHGIVQTYIQYPYLLNGYKFTLRIYVTYTSISPLQLYIYPEGFVHMATDKYNSNPKYINERYMHLTNPDINKERDFYKKNPRPFYWNFVELKNYVKKHGKMNSGPNGHDDDDLWYDIQTLVMKTVLSAEYKLNNFAIKFTQNINNFELLGIDVLVDSNLKPWLVEVNPDPDMSAHSGFQLAYETKGIMLNDLMHLLSLDQSSPITKLGTIEYENERQKLASYLLSSRKPRGKKNEVEKNSLIQIYFSTFNETNNDKNCQLNVAVTKCGIETIKDALMIVDSEVEFHRKKDFQRLIPNGQSEYLKWFYETKKTDVMLNCWESLVMACSKKDRSRQ